MARGELVLVAVGVRVAVLALVQGECAARKRAGAVRGAGVGGVPVLGGGAYLYRARTLRDPGK